jgi:hypothetical protein
MRTRLPAQVTLDEAILRWTLPQGSYYHFVASHLHQIATEEVVGGLFSETQGRPSTPPEHLVALVLLRYYEDISYEEAAERTEFDVRWKAVLGRAPQEPGPAVSDSTLQNFEVTLHKTGRYQVLFKRSVQMACEAGFVEGGLVVAQDSSPVIGKGAVKDTYNLLGDGIRTLVRALAKAQGDQVAQMAQKYGVEELFRRSTKATAQIDWADPEAKKGFLAHLVQTAQALIAAVDPREPWGVAVSVRQAQTILEKIIAQDIEQDAQGQVRLRQGVAPDRLVSVYDPEMRRGHKSQSEAFEGYKFHHTTEVQHGFILATEVTDSTTHDSVPSEPMVEQAEETTGCLIDKVIGDCAYGTEKNRVAHAEAKRELVAKLPRTPAGGIYPKHAFTIDLENQRVTCPQGVSTSENKIVRARTAPPGQEILAPDQRARLFVFSPPGCAGCPDPGACIPPGHTARTILVGPHERLFIEARAYQKTEAFQADRRARQIAEQKVARLVQLGVRVARVFGQAKVRVQTTLIAAVANLARLACLQAAAAPS